MKALKKTGKSHKLWAMLAIAAIIMPLIGLALAVDPVPGAADGVNEATSRINFALCKIAQLILLTAAGIAALVILFAGIRWVTSADDPGARQAAKTTIISAFVGLVIIGVAVYIVTVVVDGLLPSSGVKPSTWMSGKCPEPAKAPAGGGTTCAAAGTAASKTGTCSLDAATCTNVLHGTAGTGTCTENPTYPYCCFT